MNYTMSILSIDLLHGKATLKGAALHVRGVRWPEAESGKAEGESVDTLFPLHQVEQLLVTPAINMSGALLQALMLARIPVTLMGGHGYDVMGGFLPQAAPRGGLRLKQYGVSSNAGACLRIAQILVESKIYNQCRIVSKKEAAADGIFRDTMRRLRRESLEAPDIRTLMGVEGQASACYFAEWAKGLPPEFTFPGRNRNPPKDPVNSCISFLSSLCQTDMLAAIVGAGLDPDLGVLHSTEDYRHNLVLDLMEPFRPMLVDGVARDILTHGMLGVHDTEYRENGGCYLTAQGRATVIQRYGQRMRSRFCTPDTGGQYTDLRQTMRRAATCFKQCVQEPSRDFPSFHHP